LNVGTAISDLCKTKALSRRRPFSMTSLAAYA
jgi:hypothetical protein